MITGIALIVLGWIYGVPIKDVMITGVIITSIGYLLDVYILPKIGSLFTSIADFIMVMLFIILFNSYLYEPTISVGIAAFTYAILIGIGEFIFHQYLERLEYNHQFAMKELHRGYYRKGSLQTEFATEVDITSSVTEEKEKGIE